MSATTEAASTSMYSESPAEETENETSEAQEEASETSEDAAEPETEATDESESESTEAAEPEKSGRDVALQKLQQRQTTFERQLTDKFSELSTQLKSVLDAVDKRGGEPTAKQEQQIADAADDLDDLLKDLKDDDFLEGGKAKQILKTLASKINKPTKADPELDTLKQTVAELQGQIKADREATDFRKQFAKDHSEVADQLEDLLKKAGEALDDLPVKLEGEARDGAFNAVFYQMVNEAKAKGKPVPKKATPTTKTPASASAGTQTVPAGASATRATTTPKKSKPQMWVDD